MQKKTNKRKGYATIAMDEGVNYRDIASTMTELGFSMNHSSARNYVLRVMKKFVDAFAEEYDLELDEDRATSVAKSPSFQSGISDLLHAVETERRASGRQAGQQQGI